MLWIFMVDYFLMMKVKCGFFQLIFVFFCLYYYVGCFLYDDLIFLLCKLESEVFDFLRSEVELFFFFMRRMLCWILEDRVIVEEFVNDFWFGFCGWR